MNKLTQVPRENLKLDCAAASDERWKRLRDWHPDDPTSSFPFSARLQRETGWTAGFVQRGIEEYRRFVFLSLVAGHVVCPSEEVDQVWHMHLTFTRSYWHDLCGEILQGPLHHEPTRGGHDESAKHVAMYSRTLASYRDWFGEEAPRDLWPPINERFAEEHVQLVNRHEYWIIRKPIGRWWQSLHSIPSSVVSLIQPIRRRQAIWFGSLGLLTPLTLAANPLDWPGPEFLKFYLPVLVGSCVVAFLVRRLLWPVEADVPESGLDPVEVACLRGNWKLAVHAALARLMTADAVIAATAPSGSLFLRGTSSRGQITKLETAILDNLEVDHGTNLREIVARCKDAGENLESSLRQRELLTPDSGFALPARFVASGICAAVGLFGIAKIVVGMSRSKPVGFLLISLVPILIVTYFLAMRPRTTGKVRNWLRQEQLRHSSLRHLGSNNSTMGFDVAMGTALFGVAALSGSVCNSLHDEWKRLKLATGVDSTGGYAGCGGSSGGGCGGGGGGGGGCGGCGGG